ncbi:MAG TPA: ABC transporter ATP-binding protein [Clostridiales bacterium]|jgi:putative ABC transport system ATP-binding protein|nr:ABC transporter ATP-binding protein [Clostridiales bacterium]
MIIRTENISRQFRSGQEIVHALRNINIEIQSGALTILRGRSGSGKTTLINLMGALDQPSTGHIFFDGQDITRLSEAKKDQLRRNHMGFIFQSIALMPLMTAYENVEFGLRVAGYNPKDRKKRAEECLAMVGLQKRMNHRPQELSGGEQQRVAIARAVAHQPKVVFADEPTAELDTSMGLQVVKLLKDLVEEEGLTVVMTTHDPSMIDIADYVYTLDDGMVIDLAE